MSPPHVDARTIPENVGISLIIPYSPYHLLTTHILQPLTPVYRFDTKEEFVWRHEQGTLIERENETAALKKLNERRDLYKAWPVAPVPGLKTSFVKPWLFLVRIPNLSDGAAFPTTTDRFTIDIEASIVRPDGTYTLVHLPAHRISNPFENVDELQNHEARRCAAFQVDVPRSSKNADGEHVEVDLMSHFQTARAIDAFSEITTDDNKSQQIYIRWETFSLTYEAELAALSYLTTSGRDETRGPSPKSKAAFETILNFHSAHKVYYNLQEEFPHLKHPSLPQYNIPKLLLESFKRFNADHRAAYAGLARIPNGLYFLNGCPGAGKTEWNMVVAALIQARRRPGSKKRHSPVLFLVDINQTVDDAADRYFNLCKAAGLKRRVIRMHGWPYEMRSSEKLHKAPSADSVEGETSPDFTKKFLAAAGLARHTNIARSATKAPTLDEAAWEYYESHRHYAFPSLTKLLDKMDCGEFLSTEEWRALRNLVSMLYKAVLAQTDFVATTPVGAYGSFAKLFKPDVIFIDEAPHARELTTLIPLAYFDPIVWIFTGDVNQTRPFVKSGNRMDAAREGIKFNPFANQLRFSTMARAEASGAINSRLLVNNRAHGNLHRLSSKVFYQGMMVSGLDQKMMYPRSTLYLKAHMESFGAGQMIEENRIIVRLGQSSEETLRKSFWNPTHHKWLVQHAKALLNDANFRSISDPDRLGTIMIETPYSCAVRQYHAEVKQWPQEWQDRVQVVTIDKAQGNQADVVFLDMVRTTKVGFMDDPQRLNVAITRARQAEIILMHYGMTFRTANQVRQVRARYTSQIWDDAMAQHRVFTL